MNSKNENYAPIAYTILRGMACGDHDRWDGGVKKGALEMARRFCFLVHVCMGVMMMLLQ